MKGERSSLDSMGPLVCFLIQRITLFTDIYDQDVRLSHLQKPFCSPMEGISYRRRNSWIRMAYPMIEVCLSLNRFWRSNWTLMKQGLPGAFLLGHIYLRHFMTFVRCTDMARILVQSRITFSKRYITLC